MWPAALEKAYGATVRSVDLSPLEGSGQLREASNFANGKKHGDWKEYTSSGFLLRETRYDKGAVLSNQRHGIQKRYDPGNGQRFFDFDKNDWTFPPYPHTTTYPSEARNLDVSGSVLVQVTLNEVCETKELNVLKSTDPVFEKAAIDGLKEYLERLRNYKVVCPNFSETFEFNFQAN